MTPDTLPRSGFRPDVEGLRAVAVALVLLNHLLGTPVGGFVGVDVFFVISGFLITGLLVKEGEAQGRISLRDFYARRARRILPMALLVLLVTDLASRYVFTARRAAETVQDSLWASGFLANVRFTQLGTDYFQQTRPPSPVQHYWSLSVEEQFYLVWPLLLIAIYALLRRSGRARRAAVLVTLVALCVASFAWNLRESASHPASAYFSILARAWELGVSALVSVGQPLLRRLPALPRTVMSWAGLAGIAASAFVIDPSVDYPGASAVLPVTAAGLVLAAGSPALGVGHRFALGAAPIRYLGRISYGLYLWHWPCIVIGAAYFGDKTVGFYLCGSLLAMLLTIASHHLVEEPVRQSRWLDRRAQGSRRTPAEWVADHERVVLATCLVVIAGLALAAVRTPGHKAGTPVALQAASTAPAASKGFTALEQAIRDAIVARSWTGLSPSIDELPDALAPEWIKDHCLDTTPANIDSCSYGPAGAPRTAVVIGDSMAISYVPGLRAALEPRGWRLQMLTLHSCSPASLPISIKANNHTRPDVRCADHRALAVATIRRLRPDLVIATDADYHVDNLIGGGPQGDPRNYVTWTRGWTDTLNTLKPLARRVVLLAAAPGGANLQACVTRRSTPHDCLSTVDQRWLDVRSAEQAAASAAGVPFIDPQSWFCFGGACPAVIGSTPVYGDGNHLTAAYSRSLAPLLAKALRV